MKNLLVGVSLSGALALIALMAMTVGQSARADFGVPDPVAGSIATVAVDMDTTGNGPTALGGNVDTAIAGIAVNATHDIDIVLDEIHVDDSLSSFGLNILYNPSIINITAKDFSFNLTGGIEFVPDPLPDADGDLRVDVANLSPTPGLSGELILIRFTLKCIADGISVIGVNDVLGGDGIPDVFDVTGTALTVGASQNGTITCGETVQKSVDVEVTTVNITAPENVDMGDLFTVTADVKLSNLSGEDPVDVETTVELHLPTEPSICTTGDPTTRPIASTPISQAGSPVALAQQSWIVICAGPSFHPFEATAIATIVDQTILELDPENNELRSTAFLDPLSTPAVFAEADFAVGGATLSLITSEPKAGANFQLDATVTVSHISGFFPAEAVVNATLIVPPGCDGGNFADLTTRTIDLAANETKEASLSWTDVNCPLGVHEFSTNVSVSPGTHIIDTDADNDGPISSAPLSVSVINAADLQVADVTVTVPDTKAIDEELGTPEFDVMVDSSVVNMGPFGPVDADVTISLDIPQDCTATPSGDQTVLAIELLASITSEDATDLPTKTWSVSCTQPSFHNFIATVEIDFVAVSTDIADPFPDENSKSGDDTTVITANADMEVVAVTVSIPDSAELNVPFDVNVDSSVRNNGPFGPTDAKVQVSLVMTDDCTRTPDRDLFKRGLTLEVSETATDVPTMTWSVTCTETVPDTFTATVTIEPEDIHVSDTDDTNDSGVPAAVAAATATPTPTPTPTPAPEVLGFPASGSSLLGGDLRSGEIGWLLVLGAFIVGIVTLSGGITLAVRRVRRRIR